MTAPTSEAIASVAWFEMPAADTERAREFYGRVFGWRFEPDEGEDYHVTYDGGGAIHGAPEEKGLTVYFGADDIDAAIERVRSLGGEGTDKQEIPGVGFYAECTDSEGNRFGLYESGGGA